MKYHYSASPKSGKSVLHPDYWDVSTPPDDATEIVIDGDYPHIVAHFESVGVKVTRAKPLGSEMGRKELREALSKAGVEFDDKAPLKQLRALVPSND